MEFFVDTASDYESGFALFPELFTRLRGERKAEFASDLSFVDGRPERQPALAAAVTAPGTKLFGRFGEGAGQDKRSLAQVKKPAGVAPALAPPY